MFDMFGFPSPAAIQTKTIQRGDLPLEGSMFVPAGTVSFPSIAFGVTLSPRNSQGFYQVDTSNIGYAINGSGILAFGATGPVLPSTGTMKFTSGGLTSSADITLSRSAAGKLGSDSDIAVTTAGKGFRVKTGANCRIGTTTLVGGTVTVSNTSVVTGDLIFLSLVTAGGTLGTVTYTISNGASFTLTSSSAIDTSTLNWEIRGVE